jgi:hypothetical protein
MNGYSFNSSYQQQKEKMGIPCLDHTRKSEKRKVKRDAVLLAFMVKYIIEESFFHVIRRNLETFVVLF